MGLFVFNFGQMPDPGFYLVIVEPVESSQLQADFTVQKALKSTEVVNLEEPTSAVAGNLA